MQIGPYTIERELGRGGMGAVYLGRLQGDPRPFAVKVIHANLASDPDLLARFEREGQVLERLSHPNLVGLQARGRFRGGLWLAMDYVEGESLEERLARGGPLPSPLAGELLAGVAAGLAHAHRSGILHRDLKPANVLLRAADGQALVADFGLALPLDVSQHLTQTGEVLGSPGYLAPEQCGQGGGTTPATDAYGLGALLYATLTGQAPLRGRSLLETLDFVMTRRPRPPRELVPDVDPGLEAICLRCLAKEPSERYGDAQEVLDALTTEPTPSAGGKRTWILTLAGASLVGVCALLFAISLGEDGVSKSPAPTQTPGVPTTSASASTSSPRPGPSPLVSSVAEALRTGSWQAGHQRASLLSGTQRTWARYQLLAGELEATGEESEPWVAAREAALESASQDESAWSRVLSAMIESLEDLVLGERLREGDLDRLRVALEEAERLPRVVTRMQEVAIARARAEVAFRLAEMRQSEQDWVRAGVRHRAWAIVAQGSWRVELLGAFLHAAAGKRTLAFESLGRSEVAARRAEHPWAWFVLLEVRSRWLRTPGRVRLDQAWLSQTLVSGESAVPRSIRVRASLPLAVYLVQEGRSGDAVSLLNRYKPSSRASTATQLGWLEALAQALDHGGGDRARLLTLIDPEALAKAGPRQRDRLRLLRVIALSELGRVEEARALFAKIKPSDLQSSALLELRASALLGEADRFWTVFRGKPRTPKSRLYRWEELRILEGLDSRARLDLSKARDQLVEAFAGEIGQLIQGLLNEGRWAEAFDALERLTKHAQGRAQTVYGARWACQILVRAREDEEPSGDRFRNAQARCRSFIRKLTPESPAALGLGALIEAQGDPLDTSMAQLLQDLRGASNALPAWEELYRAQLDLLKKWRRRAQSPPGLPGLERQVAERWISRSQKIGARLASLLQPGPPDLVRLSNLAREAQKKRDRAQRIAVRESIRLRYLAGEIDVKPLISVLRASANWTGALRAERRWHLLEAVDLLEPPEEHAHEILSSLALIEAWCGLPTRAEELARYRRLESEANVALGRRQAALEAALPLEALALGLVDEVRSQLLCQLGRAEVLAGQPQGLARIKDALSVYASPRGYVLLARSSSEEERGSAYQKALGFPIPPAWIPSLITEIRAASCSVSGLQRAAFPLLEARSKDPDCGLRIAQRLFEGKRSRDHALLLWESYGIGSQISIDRVKDLPPKLEANLARAAKLLSAEEQTLIQALLAQFVARVDLASGVKGRDHAASVDAASSQLARAASAAREFADRLRVPLHLHAAFDDLGRLRPARTWQYLDQGLQLILTWKSRSGLPLRMPILLAYHYRMRGQFREAVKVLEEAQRGPGRAASEILGRITLDLSANLSDLNREEEALLACQEAKKSLVDYGEQARVWLLEAQIHLRAKRFEEALDAVLLASDLCPRTQGERLLFLRTQVCRGRVAVQSGNLREAQLMAQKLSTAIQEPALDPLIVGMITNFSAELELSQRRYGVALERATKALKLQPASAEAHLVRVAALVGLREHDAARAAADQAAKDTRLSPRDQARLKARGDSLR